MKYIAFPWLITVVFVVLAFSIFALLARFVPRENGGSRFSTIDGLRGYLALAVFIHHSAIWRVYAVARLWRMPHAHLFRHLGTGAVSLFFMISAFLFYRQIDRSSSIDWAKMALGRVLRMAPLYLVAVAFLFFLVAMASHFQLHQGIPKVLVEMGQWIGFTVLGAPDINGVHNTRYFMAGVVWSLPYEWAWYGVLPAISFALHRRTPIIPLVVSALSIGFAVLRLDVILILPFAGGVVAHWLTKRAGFTDFAKSAGGSVAVAALLLLAVVAFESARNPIAVILYAGAFSLIASGSDLFGILSHRVSVALGELSYGIYLFHGFLLYLLFGVVIKSHILNNLTHWLLAAGVVPVLLALALILHITIEYPAMHSRDRVYAKLKSLVHPHRITPAV